MTWMGDSLRAGVRRARTPWWLRTWARLTYRWSYRSRGILLGVDKSPW